MKWDPDCDSYGCWVCGGLESESLISIPMLRRKLQSMRITKKQMKQCDEEGMLKAYGCTDNINKLIKWLNEIEKNGN